MMPGYRHILLLTLLAVSLPVYSAPVNELTVRASKGVTTPAKTTSAKAKATTSAKAETIPGPAKLYPCPATFPPYVNPNPGLTSLLGVSPKVVSPAKGARAAVGIPAKPSAVVAAPAGESNSPPMCFDLPKVTPLPTKPPTNACAAGSSSNTKAATTSGSKAATKAGTTLSSKTTANATGSKPTTSAKVGTTSPGSKSTVKTQELSRRSPGTTFQKYILVPGPSGGMISQCTNEQITVGSTIVGGTNERRVYSVRGSTTLVVKEFRSPDNHRAQTEVAWLAQVGQLYGINGFWGTTNIPPKIVMHRQVGIPLTHTDWFLNLDRLSTADRNAVRNSVSSLVMSYALRYDALHGDVSLGNVLWSNPRDPRVMPVAMSLVDWEVARSARSLRRTATSANPQLDYARQEAREYLSSLLEQFED